MCKILVMAGIKESKQELAWKFSIAALPEMTTIDKDGIGYAAAFRGELFGERWTKPKHAFKHRHAISPGDQKLAHAFGPAVSAEPVYNSFGNPGERASAILLHSRMATCGKGLANTHPFVQGDTALIHNGVISNASTLKNLTSTCDSECILNEYLAHDVSNDPEAIDDVASALRGYYACSVITKVKGRQVVDIFKDDRASLHVAYVDALETYVFATNPEILRSAAKKCKMKISSLRPVNAGYLVRLDAASGATVSVTEFDHEASSTYTSSYLETGMGYRAAELSQHVDSRRLTPSDLASDDAPASDDVAFQLEVERRVRESRGL